MTYNRTLLKFVYLWQKTAVAAAAAALTTTKKNSETLSEIYVHEIFALDKRRRSALKFDQIVSSVVHLFD